MNRSDLDAVDIIKILIKREENDEIVDLFDWICFHLNQSNKPLLGHWMLDRSPDTIK